LSTDKLDVRYNHQRKELGTKVDTRRMEVAIMAAKRAQMITLLVQWIQKTNFTLREISSLHGTLESFTRYIKWARPLFFALQNAQFYSFVRRSN
jgi:tRNA C32,U32 (ribose-2'-O)-methylase TrmJ